MAGQNHSSKWYDNKIIVVLSCFLLFPVGLYALWKSNTISRGWKIGGTVIMAILLINLLDGDIDSEESIAETVSDSEERIESETNLSNSERVGEEDSHRIPRSTGLSYAVELGETLSTRYFDVTVNRVSLENEIDTGNPFFNLEAEDGIKYVLIDITFRNTSNESRFVAEGEIIINYDNQNYRFDKSETILVEGWGLFFEQINPLTSINTNLVYKMPGEIRGPIYYRPGRSGRNDLIFLGNI